MTRRAVRARASLGASLRIAMHRVHRKRRETNGDVLGTRLGRAVAHPLAGRRDHGLAGAHVEGAALVLDAERAVQDNSDLFEGRPLSRLTPALWRDHPRDADSGMPGVDAAGKLR